MTSLTMQDFVKIGPRTSVQTPTLSSKGELIILCTWLGAGRKAINKYVNLYRQIAPHAQILLIESGVSILTSRYARQRREILPAVSVVLNTLSEGEHLLADKMHASVKDMEHGSSSDVTEKRNPRILIQTFSNGGTNTLAQLLIVLQQMRQKPLPLVALICDSGPERGTYWRSYNGMLLSLPRGVVAQLFGAVICHCILLLLYSWIACGNENPASLQRRIMLDTRYVSAIRQNDNSENKLGSIHHNAGEAGRVCFLYSKADRITQYTDVADQAEDARRQGWQVDEVTFENSAHCAHYVKHETRYTQAIRSMWDDANAT